MKFRDKEKRPSYVWLDVVGALSRLVLVAIEILFKASQP